MIYCSTCGKAIPKDSRFCTFCGATVPVVEPGKPNIANPSPATPPNIQSSTPGPTYTRDSFIPTATPVATSKVEFFKNPGFFGGVLVIIGYFMPWILMAYTAPTGMEMLQIYLNYPKDAASIIVIVIVALPLVAGAIMVINSFTGIFSGVTGLFKWLGFIAILAYIALMGIGISQNESGATVMGIDLNDAESIVSVVGLGLWMCIGGCLIMLFNKKATR